MIARASLTTAIPPLRNISSSSSYNIKGRGFCLRTACELRACMLTSLSRSRDLSLGTSNGRTAQNGSQRFARAGLTNDCKSKPDNRHCATRSVALKEKHLCRSDNRLKHVHSVYEGLINDCKSRPDNHHSAIAQQGERLSKKSKLRTAERLKTNFATRSVALKANRTYAQST